MVSEEIAKKLENEEKEKARALKKPSEENNCQICFDSLFAKGGDPHPMACCGSCLHKQCLEMYLKDQVICLFFISMIFNNLDQIKKISNHLPFCYLQERGSSIGYK